MPTDFSVSNLHPSAAERIRLFSIVMLVALMGAGVIIYTSSRSMAASALPPVAPDTVQLASNADSTDLPCTLGAHYVLPVALSTEGRASGVYVQIDKPASYAVGGSTPSEIMDNIATCTPVREGGLFAANTGYNLSTYYTFGPTGSGLCQVTNAIVTLHVNQVFPQWTGQGDAPTQHAWQQFITNLRTHESGHVELDKTYAQKTYAALVTTAPGYCATFKQSADKNVQTVSDELASQNDRYDAQTKHGTTQGAVL